MQRLFGWEGRREALTFGFAWIYLVSMTSVLAGLFLPFAEQQYGCPRNTACLLLAELSQPPLVGKVRLVPPFSGLCQGHCFSDCSA